MLDLELLAPERPRRIRRSEYLELAELGAFDDERVELLYGVIVEMSPPDSPQHSSPIQVLNERLVLKLAGRASVRTQLPYACDDESQPVPDFAVVPVGRYWDDHPQHAHCIIEVALSSLRKDRLVKAPLYAASRVSEYWIADVSGRCFHVFRNSNGSAYESETRYDMGDSVALEAFPDVVITVADVFG
jgi:Uma2 family endonuclease